MYEYNAKVLNVVDGDTFDMDIDLGFHIHVHERVRVLDLDTPEKRGSKEKKLGQIVTEYTKVLFEGRDVVITSKKPIPSGTDSFGRWLVDVQLPDDLKTNNCKLLSELYTFLHINKYADNYCEESVLNLQEILSDAELV